MEYSLVKGYRSLWEVEKGQKSRRYFVQGPVVYGAVIRV